MGFDSFDASIPDVLNLTIMTRHRIWNALGRITHFVDASSAEFRKELIAIAQDGMLAKSEIAELATELKRSFGAPVLRVETGNKVLWDTAKQAAGSFGALRDSSLSLTSGAPPAFAATASFCWWFASFLFIIAILTVTLCLGYALYLEYFWKDEEVDKLWHRDPGNKHRFWGIANRAFARVGVDNGFWIFVAVLDLIGVLMLFVAATVAAMGMLRRMAMSGCASAPLFTDDLRCTQVLKDLDQDLCTQLLNGSGLTCGEAGLLVCNGPQNGATQTTVLAAILGLSASCCLPQRMIAVWGSARQTVQMARMEGGYKYESLSQFADGDHLSRRVGA